MWGLLLKKSIVIYDGDCGICEKCRDAIEKLDWLKRYECHPLQQPELYVRFPVLTQEECLKELKLVKPSGNILGGADAVIEIGKGLPLLFIFAWIFWLPLLRQLARWLYPIIADHRYLISSSCGLKNRTK